MNRHRFVSHLGLPTIAILFLTVKHITLCAAMNDYTLHFCSCLSSWASCSKLDAWNTSPWDLSEYSYTVLHPLNHLGRHLILTFLTLGDCPCESAATMTASKRPLGLNDHARNPCSTITLTTGMHLQRIILEERLW